MSDFEVPQAVKDQFRKLGKRARELGRNLAGVYRDAVAIVDADRPVFCDCDKPLPTLKSGVLASVERWSEGGIVKNTFSSAWSLFVRDADAFGKVDAIGQYSRVLASLRKATREAAALATLEADVQDRVARSDGKLSEDDARAQLDAQAKSAADAGAQAKSLDDVAAAIRVAVHAGVTQGELAARIGRELRALGVVSAPAAPPAPDLKVAVA